MTNQEKINAITEKLMKFCDPKPEYSGLFASHLAQRLFKIAVAENNCRRCGDGIEKRNELCEQCDDVRSACREVVA